MSIFQYVFETQNQEYFWIAKEISKQLETVKLSEIAVLSRKNKDLEGLIPYLNQLEIPYFFEKYSNVLETQSVRELIILLKFVDSLNQNGGQSSDFLLPEILSCEFFEVTQLDIWLISQFASSSRISWLQAMLEADTISVGEFRLSDNQKIKQLALVFLELKKLSFEKLALEIIDILLGNVELKLETNEATISWLSPFKSYYFEKNHANSTYQDFLTSLQTLLDAVKQNSELQNFRLHDLVVQLELLEKNRIRINSKNFSGLQSEGVNLLTSHKSKGMEFETVFILNCTESAWMKNVNRSLLSFPKNLDLSAQKDDVDDKLRLLYVAITRAKRNLFFTYPNQNSLGRENLAIGFLPEKWEPKKLDETEKTKALEINSTIYKPLNLQTHENLFLRNLVENYQLSVTHLLNFIDVSGGGPEKFLQNNLLRFPSLKNSKSTYGTATHGALKRFQLEFKKNQKLPKLEFLLQSFQDELSLGILNPVDFARFLKKGNSDLTSFYEQKADSFNILDLAEFSFKNQNVFLGKANLTGQLDKIELDTSTRQAVVVDYKSSKPLEKSKSSDEFSKTRLYKYQVQIGFYKFLVENSREFAGKFEVNSGKIVFLEPSSSGLFLDYEINLDQEFVSQLEILTQKVYDKIINLDFPEISKYEASLKGTLDFVDDLVLGRI